jgi:hypothetical protein
MGVEQYGHSNTGLAAFDESADDLVCNLTLVKNVRFERDRAPLRRMSTRLSPRMGAPAKASNEVRNAGSSMCMDGTVSGAGVDAQPASQELRSKTRTVLNPVGERPLTTPRYIPVVRCVIPMP